MSKTMALKKAEFYGEIAKLVNSLKEQMKTGQAKHQEEIYKFTDRLRIESETVIELREEVENI